MTHQRLDSSAVLKLVDLAYDDWNDADWRSRLLVSVRDLLPHSRTTGIYEYTSRVVPDGLALTIKGDVDLLGDDALETGVRAVEMMPPPMTEALHLRSAPATASEQSGHGAALAEQPSWRRMWRAPIQDALALVFRDLAGDGMVIFAGLNVATTLTLRERSLLAKVIVHLGAGQRLHHANGVRPLEEAEAVLSPSGELLHANERALAKRDVLEEGRLRRAEARRHDAEKALEVWKGLVAGRWSLVDHFDNDGKRFLLAMKNTAKVDAREALTPRERRVCELAARGHRDKEIAYTLGLSMASVSGSLHRARIKLGVESRAALALAWRGGRV